jgi:hypothetical protein
VSKLIDKEATKRMLDLQIRQTEIDLSDERANVKAHAQHLDAARARVVDLEGHLGLLKDLMEHVE